MSYVESLIWDKVMYLVKVLDIVLFVALSFWANFWSEIGMIQI